MNHFKDFLIKLQTLDIRINQKKEVRNGQQQEIYSYDISHQNPFLSQVFKNELKQLKELAITDILILPREQILLQLQRLDNIKAQFSRFWDSYSHSPVPMGSEHNLELVLRLDLNNMFLCPSLSFTDHADATDYFIDELESTIRYRQIVLQEFEQAVSKIIEVQKEPATVLPPVPTNNKVKATPVFKEGISSKFFHLVKDYFSERDQQRLMDLSIDSSTLGEPLVFSGAGNQLADAFKQLYDSNLIVGCNKTELEDWILTNFQYRDKGQKKRFTEKYLQDMISSNTKTCQSPLFDVKRSDGQFYLSPLTRNNKK